MTAIKNLHDLNDEVLELEQKYNQALNYICALRQTQAAILTGIVNNRIDTVKDIFIWSNFEEQQKELTSTENIEKELQHYSTQWDD